MGTYRLRSLWAIGLLAAVAAGLVTAFVVGPAALLRPGYERYADDATMQRALVSALVEFWRDGGATTPPALADLVDYWFAWHAIKVAISLPMVAAFGLLSLALWSRYLGAGRRSAAWFALGGTISAAMTSLAAFLLAANIQATSTPLIALLPCLPHPGADVALTRTLDQMRAAVTHGTDGPALQMLLNSVGRYEWIMAITAGTLTVLLVAASLTCWRRRRNTANGDRLPRMWSTLGVVTALSATGFLLVTAFSIFSALTPRDALLGLIAML